MWNIIFLHFYIVRIVEEEQARERYMKKFGERAAQLASYAAAAAGPDVSKASSSSLSAGIEPISVPVPPPPSPEVPARMPTQMLSAQVV